MILNFDKFEKASRLLESHAPDELNSEVLETHGVTASEVESVNEGFLKDLFGGWFKKLRTSMLRKMPGGALRRADEVVAKYEQERLALMKASLKEKEKIYKAEIGLEKDPSAKSKYDQIIDRSNTALGAIKKASDAKIAKIDAELEELGKGKSDAVLDYINLKVAEVKEKIAAAELKEIQKYATEERVEKAEKDFDEMKKSREALQKDLEKAINSLKDMPGMSAKKGEEWVRKTKKGDEVTVQIAEEPGKDKAGEVRVKTKGGKEYSAKIESLIKKA